MGLDEGACGIDQEVQWLRGQIRLGADYQRPDERRGPRHWQGGSLDVVLRLQDSPSPLPSDTNRTPGALIYTHPGIPAYMGINGAGISILWQYIDNGERADPLSSGVPTCVVLREIL